MRLFVFLGGMLVLALLAALVVPPFVDWNQFRDRFEQEASKIVGQEVRVLGQTSARLLPLPSVTFQKIRIGNSEEPMLAADNIHINMELAPLLKGDVSIVDMALTAPRLDLRIRPDGELDWSARAVEMPADFKASAISLNEIAINNGVVRLRDERDQREFLLRNIDLKGSARSLAGPWRAEGFVSRAGQRFQVSGSSGQWQEAKSASEPGQLKVRLDVKAQNIPYDVEFEGPIVMRDGVPQFSGNFKVTPMAKQSDAIRIAFDRSDAGAALAGVLDGVVKIGARGAVVPDYKLRVGDADDPYVVSGSAFANFDNDASFEINADGQQVNFARLETQAESTNNQPKTAQDRLVAFYEILKQVPRFSVPGSLNMTLPAIVAGDTVVRDIEIAAAPLKGQTGWKLQSLKAELPGRTKLFASGDLGLDDSLTYQGSLILASRQPSGFASWLVKEVPAPIRALRNAGFSGDVSLGKGVLQAQNAELVLDGVSLKGGVEQVEDADGSAILKTRLAGKEINYDALAALAGIFVNDDATAQHTVDFDVKTDLLRAFGVLARDVDATGILSENSLRLHNLKIGALNDAAISLAGKVQRKNGKLVGGLKGVVKADTLSGLLALAHSKYRPLPTLSHLIEVPDLTANSDVTITLSDNGVDSALTMSGVSGGSELAVDMKLEGKGAEADGFVSVTSTIENPRADILMAQLGLPVLPLDTGESASVNLTAEGVVSDNLTIVSSFDVADVVGALQGGLKPSLTADGLRVVGTIDLDARASNLDTFVSLTGYNLPRFGEGLNGEVQAALTIAKDAVSAEKLVLRHGDTQLRGELMAEFTDAERVQVSGVLKSEFLRATDIVALVHARESQDEDVDTRTLAGIDGSIGLTVAALELSGGNAVKVENVKSLVTINDGDLSFGDVTGRLFGAGVNGKLAVGRAGTANVLSGNLDMKDADLARILPNLGYDVSGAGKVSGNVNFDVSASAGADLLGAVTGGGAVRLEDASIDGFNDDAFAGFLDLMAEREAKAGANVSAVKLEDNDLARAGLFDGQLKLAGLEIPFSITSGVLRSSDIRFQNDRVEGRGDVKLTFASQQTQVKMDVAFAPGKEAIIGAEPEISLSYSGTPNSMSRNVEVALLETYLGQRSAEQRERAYLSQQAAILDRQRLGRENHAIAMLRSLDEERRKRREEALRRAEEVAKEEAAKKAAEKAAKEAAKEAAPKPDKPAKAPALPRLNETRLNETQLDVSDGINELSQRVLESVLQENAPAAQ